MSSVPRVADRESVSKSNMSAINSETFRAGTFDFYIGPDEVHFILYKSLVSRYSEPLGRLMTNGMKESREGKAFLKDVDPDTFCRFAEFIHSGDYSAAAPVEDPTPPTESGANLAQVGAEDDWEWGVPSKKKKKKKGRVTSWDGVAEEGYVQEPREGYPNHEARWGGVFGVSTNYPDEPPPPPPPPAPEVEPKLVPPFPVNSAPGLNQSPNMNYTQAFACHISVYHFAEFYLVSGLKKLATQKLSEALNLFRCFPERTTDICHIVRLVYNHEDGDTHPSPLHDIVSNYAKTNFKVLMASSHFKDLLAEGGLFAPDVCSKVARLLN